MQTIAFEETVDSGIINIPEKYRNMAQNGTKVQIVIRPVSLQKTDVFPFAAIDMSGFTFNRDEINER